MRHLAKGIAAPLEGAKAAAQIAFDAADWRRVTGGVLEEGVAEEMGPEGIELVREEQVGLVALGILAKGRGEPAQPVHARTRTRATCREGCVEQGGVLHDQAVVWPEYRGGIRAKARQSAEVLDNGALWQPSPATLQKDLLGRGPELGNEEGPGLRTRQRSQLSSRTRPARVEESTRLTGWSGYCSTTALTFAMAARLVRRAGESAKARAKAAERRMATRYRLTNAWEGAAVMRSLTARVRGEDCQQWSDGPMLLTREAQVQPTAAGAAPSNSMSHP